jgi:hypothetical protein
MKKNVLLVLLLVQVTSLSSSEKDKRKKSTRHRNHWLFPDGDRNSTKELKIANCFMYGDTNCSTIVCRICNNNLPTIPEFSSTGDTLKALKLHLD